MKVQDSAADCGSQASNTPQLGIQAPAKGLHYSFYACNLHASV